MMPQKRNPDTLEVMKAKAATAQGILTALISVGRSLFLGYNRDTQWTKYYIMDLVDETLPAPGVAAEILSSLQVNRMKAAALCEKGFIAAPDLLEELVQKEALPFRRAKVLVEKAVKYSEGKGAARVLPWALQKALQEDGLDLALERRPVLRQLEDGLEIAVVDGPDLDGELHAFHRALSGAEACHRAQHGRFPSRGPSQPRQGRRPAGPPPATTRASPAPFPASGPARRPVPKPAG